MRIALLTVVAGDCTATWERFAHLAEKYFMPCSERHFFVFSETDGLSCPLKNVTFFPIGQKDFAEIHLRRHRWCLAIKERLEAEFDYAYFLPVFAEFQRKIDTDFLPDDAQQLVAVQHPRFVNIPPDRLPLERNRRSQAFVRIGEWTQYITSEIYGGTVGTFLKMSRSIDDAIARDAVSGVSACRQLESHLNRYVIDHPATIRHAGYSYPEGWDLGVPKVIQMADGGLSEQYRDWRGYQPIGLRESVSVEICGDLGQQLTQYATGRMIAQKRESRLWLDTKPLNENERQSFALGHFRINAEIAHQTSDSPLTAKPLSRLFEQLWPGRRLKKIQLQDDLIDTESLNWPGRLHLTCHRHCATGMDDIRQAMTEELSVSTELSEPTQRLLREIESVWAVAVHVPRNESAFSKWCPNSAGCLPAAYYQQAIDYLISQLPAPPVFYFFTDDVDWVKSSLRCPSPHQIIDHREPSKAHEDFRLMQACRSKIISQASISWWAAWLSDGQGHSVVAPMIDADSQPSINTKPTPDGWIWIDYQNLPCQNREGQITRQAA